MSVTKMTSPNNRKVRREVYDNGTPPLLRETTENAKIWDMEIKLNEQEGQIASLSNRLSQLSMESLRNESLNITDKSSHPRTIMRRFSDLYSYEWNTAFKELNKDEYGYEETAINILCKILKHAYRFCLVTSMNQLADLTNNVKDQLQFPNIINAPKEILVTETVPEETGLSILNEIGPAVKEIRKRAAVSSIPCLKMLFRNFVMDDLGIQAQKDTPLCIYADRCVELCWLMVVQEPPMCLDFCRPGEVNLGKFKSYSDTERQQTITETCVWPALCQNENGPVLMQGVAIMK
ncbi:hypothetical protein CHS0354_026390 [Potamilus streckersoni]|uniref:Mitochondria-eating protein C-terminal domain-containing protein n=1 Tax=Potamilus streckersoni TaxID=2493646 RepID=A0AAE0W7A0_9BIVA|nr:hypothetical protein CHS0354_026390 [Potamilus streckersoni]